MKYEITYELAQALLNYLSKRPFEEVFKIIQELQQIKPITEPKDSKTDT
jgi:hypothetical protein